MQKEEIYVPGRLCLFGEHSDWASEYRRENKDIEKGYALVTTIDHGIKATISPCNNFKFSFKNKLIDIPIKKISFNQKMGDEFFSLVISVAKFMYQKYDVGGLSIKINFMDLPIGVGLSSSSAIAVLVVKSFNLIYKLNLNDYEVMDDAYNSERNAGFKCGRMDHICTFSKKLLLMEFDEKLNIKEIIPKKKIHLVFCIIQKKDTKKILELLNKSYPIALSKKDSLIQNSLGIKNKKIVYEAIEYIESGNYKKLGMLMKKSQNYFDKEVFLGTDFDEIKLKQIISDDTISSLILGAKGVGSHGDGAVQFLVQSSKKQNELIKRIKELGYNAYKFDI